jgi:hypothetical protein
MFMKTFEEKWTAWLDGKLTGQELAQFEDSLGDRAAAEKERVEAKKLGALLKQELGADVLSNADFFSHQIHEAIQREEAGRSTRLRPGYGGQAWWSIPRLAWAGTTSLAIFIVCAFFVMQQDAQPPSDYLTQIVTAKLDPTANPYATTSVLEAKKDRVTVLWVEGLQSLPADYAAK